MTPRALGRTQPCGREQARVRITQARFLDLHRRTWPGWEGESEIRQVFGPES